MLPQRKIDRLSGDGGIASLAAFLNNSKSPKSNKLSSSRSVGAMPTSGASFSSKKPLRRRLKKKDDESLASAASKRPSKSKQIKGHSSMGSGLDLHSASSTPMEAYGGSKMRGRKPKSRSSSGSSDDSIEDQSLHVSDILGTNNNGNAGGSTKKSMERLNRSMGDIAFKASDLGSLLAQQKEFKRRSGGASVVSELLVDEEQQDDIFSTYSWTTSRQLRHKVQEERKLLNETLRQGTFEKAFQMFVGVSTT